MLIASSQTDFSPAAQNWRPAAPPTIKGQCSDLPLAKNYFHWRISYEHRLVERLIKLPVTKKKIYCAKKKASDPKSPSP